MLSIDFLYLFLLWVAGGTLFFMEIEYCSFHSQSDNSNCCLMLNTFKNNLEAVLKIFRYTIQAPVYKETVKELTDIYGNLSFLQYNNITEFPVLKAPLVTSNSDARIFLCQYAGIPEQMSPSACDLFFRSITNQGFGYSFNMANFWDIFSKKNSFNKKFSKIMRPKGHDQPSSPMEIDEDDDSQRWVYPKKGVLFPEVNI